jgi:hypothetical protein
LLAPGVLQARLGARQRGVLAVASLAIMPAGLLIHGLIDAPIRAAIRL